MARPDEEATRYCAHGFVSGRVQGVWFRESTRRRAVELGLSGWVRNLADGRVEARFVGPKRLVEEAIAFVGVGPPHAHVSRTEGFEIEVLETDRANEREQAGFLIR